MNGRVLLCALLLSLAGFGTAAADIQQPTTTCGAVFSDCAVCKIGSKGADVLCASCKSGFGFKDGACAACSAIDPNCTSCVDGACTGCAPGFGPTSGGASCQACSSITPNCSACGTGICTACTNGTAANLAGACVQPGTSSCTLDVSGQCCRCPAGQVYNSASKSCVGANIGSTCEARQ